MTEEKSKTRVGMLTDLVAECIDEERGHTLLTTLRRSIAGVEDLMDYDNFVEEMWFYDPQKHGNMPELGYTALKLGGECGEIQEKIGKAYRDNDGEIANKRALIKEFGDVLFYIVKLSHILGFTLNDVSQANREKLIDRKQRGVLKGEGDDR